MTPESRMTPEEWEAIRERNSLMTEQLGAHDRVLLVNEVMTLRKEYDDLRKVAIQLQGKIDRARRYVRQGVGESWHATVRELTEILEKDR